MTTPTTTEALAGALDMLKHIGSGNGCYSVAEYERRVRSYYDALNDRRQLDIQDARRREQIRELARTRNGLDLNHDAARSA